MHTERREFHPRSSSQGKKISDYVLVCRFYELAGPFVRVLRKVTKQEGRCVWEVWGDKVLENIQAHASALLATFCPFYISTAQRNRRREKGSPDIKYLSSHSAARAHHCFSYFSEPVRSWTMFRRALRTMVSVVPFSRTTLASPPRMSLSLFTGPAGR